MIKHRLPFYGEDTETRVRSNTFILTVIILVVYFTPLFIIDVFSGSVLKAIIPFILPSVSPVIVVLRETQVSLKNVDTLPLIKYSAEIIIISFVIMPIVLFIIMFLVAAFLSTIVDAPSATNARIIFVSLLTIFASLISVVVVEIAFIQRHQSLDSADASSIIEVSIIQANTDAKSRDDISTDDSDTNPIHKKETPDVDQLQKRATDAVSQAKEAKADKEYQQALDSYEEAIAELEQAVTASNDEVREEIKSEIAKIQSSVKIIKDIIQQRDSVSATLRAAEESFEEAIARYAAGNQTVARIRFRQSRNAFEDAHMTIKENENDLLANKIEVMIEPEKKPSSTTLSELSLIPEEAVAELADAGIESIEDLHSSAESPWTPAVVEKLVDSGSISEDISTTLTLLSWWHGDERYTFKTADAVALRQHQADYGFNYIS